MSNPPLDDSKFTEKVQEKLGFLNDKFQSEREDLMFKHDRNLTKNNKKLLEKMNLVHKHLKNIVDNSKQSCDFCKIMNTTQNKWEPKTFESEVKT